MLVLSECHMYLLYTCTLAVSKSFSMSFEKKYYSVLSIVGHT